MAIALKYVEVYMLKLLAKSDNPLVLGYVMNCHDIPEANSFKVRRQNMWTCGFLEAKDCGFQHQKKEDIQQEMRMISMDIP